MTHVKTNREPASLVERAVAKLASEARNEGPPAGAQVRRAEEARRDPARPAGDAPAPLPRESKRMAVDLNKLRAAGIFAPDSALNRTTEEFRLIKRAVLLNADERLHEGAHNANLIMVTSCRQGEGKTFVSFNLAMSIAAEKDHAVLLVDADPNRSAVLARLGIRADGGLVDVLHDSSLNLADVLIRTDVESFSILPAGQPHPLNAELFASARMGQFVAEISKRYADRIIIFDTPPVLATTEPTALALHMGQILFVVEAGKTSRSAIKEALNLIGVCPNIGFVLNRARFEFGGARFGSYYKSYRKSYYKTYRRIS